MQPSKTMVRKNARSELVKSVWSKLDALSHDQKINVFKALTIDPENLVPRSENQFQSPEKDPAIASYEFNYYQKRRFLLF